jgi:hypothetical protein
MSLCEIDSLTYAALFRSAFKGYLSRGYDPQDARRHAQREMAGAFVVTDHVIAREQQKDDDDVRDNDWTA